MLTEIRKRALSDVNNLLDMNGIRYKLKEMIRYATGVGVGHQRIRCNATDIAGTKE